MAALTLPPTALTLSSDLARAREHLAKDWDNSNAYSSCEIDKDLQK